MARYVANLALTGRIMNFFCRTRRRTVVLLSILASALLHPPVQAADFAGCSGCHKEVLEEVFRTYLHVPFQQRRCGECHEAKESVALLVKDQLAGLDDRRKKVDWLGESVMADTRHGFVLPGGRAGDTLVVDLHGSDGTFSRQEITIPPLGALAQVEDIDTPPVISGVRVLKVQRGVFLSATVGWQTDTLTDALVRYGINDLSQTAQPGKRLGRRHEVVLYNLKPDKTYRFSVVSKDLFGRSQASEPLTFSTSKPLSAPQPAPSVNPPESEEKAGLTSHFQRTGTNYLLELTMEQPSSASVGTRKASRVQKLDDESMAPTGGINKFHAELSSKQVVAMESCRNCHRDQTTATHPVNVYPKPGMVIPPEYPTLPDGRITCRSCHESHSADNEFLTIKGGRRELCVGCHRDMI